jgi:hypothetical protein
LQKIPTVGAKETCTCTLIEAKKTFKCKLQLEQARTCAPTSHPHFTPHTPHTHARTETHKHTQTHKRHMCGRYLSISRSLERYGHQRPRNLRNFVGHVHDLSIHVACSSRVRCLHVCVERSSSTLQGGTFPNLLFSPGLPPCLSPFPLSLTRTSLLRMVISRSTLERTQDVFWDHLLQHCSHPHALAVHHVLYPYTIIIIHIISLLRNKH